jgi:hypothetical protein
MAGIVLPDGQDGEVGAAHPQVGLKTVRAEQAAVGKILRYDR